MLVLATDLQSASVAESQALSVFGTDQRMLLKADLMVHMCLSLHQLLSFGMGSTKLCFVIVYVLVLAALEHTLSV